MAVLSRLLDTMAAPAKQQPDRLRHVSRDTVEIRERALAIVESAQHGDIVERWKNEVLSSIGQESGHDATRNFRFVPGIGLLTDWLRGVWRAHDAALGIEKLIAKAQALLQADDATGAAHIAGRALEHALLDEYRTRLWLITAWAGCHSAQGYRQGRHEGAFRPIAQDGHQDRDGDRRQSTHGCRHRR
jgi:hypothetical protein